MFVGMMILPLLVALTPLFAFADYSPFPGHVWIGWFTGSPPILWKPGKYEMNFDLKSW